MTKGELLKQVSDEVGSQLSAGECKLVFEAILAKITEALEQGGPVEIRGFGTFKVRDRKARKGQNPRTGEAIDIPAARVPAFQPSKLLRDRVNSS